MQTGQPLDVLSDLAAQQHGMFTSAQATEAGVPRYSLNRLVNKGAFTRVRQGVYISTAHPTTPITEVRAQWLALNPSMMANERNQRISETIAPSEAVISHETAASLHGIGDLIVSRVDFTVLTRRQTRQPDVRFHYAELSREDITIADGLPVTTVVRTIRDLALSGHEPGHLFDMMADALDARLVSRDDLNRGLSDVAVSLGAYTNTADEMERLLAKELPDPVTFGDAWGSQPLEAALASELRKIIASVDFAELIRRTVSS